jgi:large subunit ribosomal protein L18
MNKNIAKKQTYLKRKKRVRKKIWGTIEQPRLSVFRSARHIYAQIVNDDQGMTLVAVSSMSKEIGERAIEGAKKGIAKKVGELLAERALSKGIQRICFDRGGYKYHGRVGSLAEGARHKGLDF